MSRINNSTYLNLYHKKNYFLSPMSNLFINGGFLIPIRPITFHDDKNEIIVICLVED